MKGLGYHAQEWLTCANAIYPNAISTAPVFKLWTATTGYCLMQTTIDFCKLIMHQKPWIPICYVVSFIHILKWHSDTITWENIRRSSKINIHIPHTSFNNLPSCSFHAFAALNELMSKQKLSNSLRSDILFYQIFGEVRETTAVVRKKICWMLQIQLLTSKAPAIDRVENGSTYLFYDQKKFKKYCKEHTSAIFSVCNKF